MFLLIEAATKMPWAVQVGPIQEHEALGTRALVTQARLNLQGTARLHQGIVDKGFGDGTTLWWLAQHAVTLVVPAKAHMAVPADARAQAAAGEAITLGRRVHTRRHGQGRKAWTERLETDVVGLTGLTTSDQYGTPAPASHAHRRDFQAHPIHAVVVRKWPGKDDGPGGTTVFVTNVPGDQPVRPFDDDDDRSLIEHGCLTETKQPWDLGHPPQKTQRAVRVHVLCTLLLFALATAYRLPCEREATDGEPVGWQRWRRQLLEQTRDHVIVLAQGYDGIFHLAAYSLLVGGQRKDVPPGIGTRQDVLAKYKLTKRG